MSINIVFFKSFVLWKGEPLLLLSNTGMTLLKLSVLLKWKSGSLALFSVVTFCNYIVCILLPMSEGPNSSLSNVSEQN